ncbi:hypothetical protein IRP63_07175 [Clostridium botulinum]|uniref:Uncharacterized protein n=1 Tax=Clostridium botulinum C/D str. DC5 TaxID=1443128 RepID=A0A0A0IKG0_CLOBO|nr:hypothetical protein [Clostridium botulinum]KGN01965.1 hypothetical protein Z955_00770 [Clostridium botulinum C/D str. DC5]KOC55587.1 hypothetical protein ADU89_04520 [Clostridium botulinum]KOC57494.1 hypothetical protein ADU90_04645 [Clostridium botulinum]MCD3232699.1 hypothetical protein [Clostridium botulinum D/C]MCD3238561.1 hypothetical protein [Clostridium botulinum D/C]
MIKNEIRSTKVKKKFIDGTTYASSPGSVTISKKKLKRLRPDLYGIRAKIGALLDTITIGFSEQRQIKEHIFYGDSQPAVVMSNEPLIIAAYSDDIDCVVILKFDDKYSKIYNLKKGDRLISINTYMRGTEYQKDIIIGPNNTNTWFGYSPIIADFISDDIHIIEEKKKQIDEALWNYVFNLGIEYMKIHPNIARDGRPLYSSISAI